MPVLGERLGGLRDDIAVFFVRGHIFDIVGNGTGLFVDAAVRRLDKAIIVDARVGGQRTDQTDVRAFRRFNGADARIVRIVHVAHGEGRAVAVQAARAQRGKAALMREFGQRVGLVHELRKLRGTEEFLDGGRNGPDVDQILRARLAQVLDGHALLHAALQARHAHANLVLQKLAHGAQAAVAHVVDIVHIADAVEQAELVAHRGQNIVHQNVLGNQLGHVVVQGLVEIHAVGAHALDDREQGGQVYALAHIHLFLVELLIQFRLALFHISAEIHKVVADHVDFAAIHHHGHAVDARVLDAPGGLGVNHIARFHQQLARGGMRQRFHGFAAIDAQGQRQLFIELIATHAGEIVPLGVEEQIVHQLRGALHRRRFARAQLVVNFNQRLFAAGAAVFALFLRRAIARDGGGNALVPAEHIDDFRVAFHAQGAQKHRHRQFAGAVDAAIHHGVGIGFELDPRAPVGDHLRGIQVAAALIDGAGEIRARRTHELADNDALRAIDHEGAVLGHQREIPHEDLAFLHFVRIAVGEAHRHFQRRGKGKVALAAPLNRVLRLVERIIDELQHQAFAVIGNRRCVSEHLSQSLVEKVLIRALLHLNQIRHLKRFVNLGKELPRPLSLLHLVHSAITPS